MSTKNAPCILDRGRHARLPLIKGLPSGLDGADDPFFKMSGILLHDDDGLLECILLIYLLMKLANDGQIGNESVDDECEAGKGKLQCTHGSVLAVTCSGVFLKVEISLVSWATRRVDSSRSFATLVASLPVSFWTFYKRYRINLDIGSSCTATADLDMGLYLYAQFLEVLYYRTVDCTTKIGVLIRDDASFITDAIIYILQRSTHVSELWGSGNPRSTHLETTFTEELVSGAKRDLNDGGKLCHLFCGVILDVCNTLDKSS